MVKPRPLPPLAELCAEFEYNPETGLFTRSGAPAGTINTSGYVKLKFKQRSLTAHRVAWYITTGLDPLDLQVDHRDRDRSNNRFSNLRLATPSNNSFNRTGVKGYHKHKDSYRARIVCDSNSYSLGLFSTAQEARAAYYAKAVELRGEFATRTWRQDSA